MKVRNITTSAPFGILYPSNAQEIQDVVDILGLSPQEIAEASVTIFFRSEVEVDHGVTLPVGWEAEVTTSKQANLPIWQLGLMECAEHLDAGDIQLILEKKLNAGASLGFMSDFYPMGFNAPEVLVEALTSVGFRISKVDPSLLQ